MGTLRATDPEITKDEEGNDVVTWVQKGLVVNGVMLGEPIELDNNPLTAEWDDSAYPNGTIDRAGIVTPDEEEVI